MDQSPEVPAASADPLDVLRIAYPQYEFEREPRTDKPRYMAMARELGVSPWCIITDNFDELKQTLEAIKKVQP